MKDKVFQEDCFELDHVALPDDICMLPRQQDLAHNNLLVSISFKRFFIVFCCVLQQLNQAYLFIEVFVHRGPQKLSVQWGPLTKECVELVQII